MTYKKSYIFIAVFSFVASVFLLARPALAAQTLCCKSQVYRRTYECEASSAGNPIWKLVEGTSLTNDCKVSASCAAVAAKDVEYELQGAGCLPDTPNPPPNLSPTPQRYGRKVQTETVVQQVNCETDNLCLAALANEGNCKNLRSDSLCNNAANCFWYGAQCESRYDTGVCSRIKDKGYCGETKGALRCVWDQGLNKCITAVESTVGGRYKGLGGALPPCAVQGTCRDVNELVEVIISYLNMLFGVIGAIAFGFFVYGGFTMILSLGNPEKITHGKQILAAAIVGLIIAFSAYLLVDFILDTLQVQSGTQGFRAIQ